MRGLKGILGHLPRLCESFLEGLVLVSDPVRSGDDLIQPRFRLHEFRHRVRQVIVLVETRDR